MTTKETIKFNPDISVSDEDLNTVTTYQCVTGKIVTPVDATTREQMFIIEASGALSFWDNPGEDCYSGSDGDAI